jgi:hypothetical protein
MMWAGSVSEPTLSSDPATKTLKANVNVGGKWYGPAYGNADVPDEIAERITNPKAFEDPPPSVAELPAAGPGDFARIPAVAAEQYTLAELAGIAARVGVDVPPLASKADIVEALRSAGRSG